MRDKAIFEINQKWKKIVQYYDQILKDWLNNYFNNHPNIGQLLEEESNQKLDYIKNVNLFDLFQSTVDRVEEVIESRELHHFKNKLPKPFKHKDLAEDLVGFVQNYNQEAFAKYKSEMFNEWQREWLRTLANIKRQVFQLNIIDYGKKPLFLINAYISEFELIHNLMLIPFTKNVALEEASYRNRLKVLIDCIFFLEFDDKDKNSLLMILEDIFEPKKRNSLAKHNYMFNEEGNKIHLFSPDAIVRKYKPFGEIEYRRFIADVIFMKSIFWILIKAICKTSNELKNVVDEIITLYPPLFTVIERYIINPDLIRLLNLFGECYKSFSSNFNMNFEEEHGGKIVRSQLLESFLIFRILIGAFLKPDIIPRKNELTSFSMFHGVVITHSMLKIQYLVTYEEMMQTVVHPFTEMLFGTTFKDYTLKKLKKIENGKYSVLFEAINKDFRDSLAHNSYFFDEKDGWVYTKYGKELERENIKLTSSQLVFNYIDITNAIFPFLAEMPTELASAQLIKDLFTKDSTFTPEEWLEKEKFALNHSMLVFAGMARIRLAIHYANKHEYNAMSNIIREVFENHESYNSLSSTDLELFLAFILGFITKIRSRIVLKVFTKRIIKSHSLAKEMEINCLFVLLFLASHQRDRREVNKLLKRINDCKKQHNS